MPKPGTQGNRSVAIGAIADLAQWGDCTHTGNQAPPKDGIGPCVSTHPVLLFGRGRKIHAERACARCSSMSGARRHDSPRRSEIPPMLSRRPSRPPGRSSLRNGRLTSWRPSIHGQRCANYQLLELLGRGGMAEVYVAYPVDAPGRPQLRALKALQRKWAMDPQLRAMFKAEGELTQSLRHRNVVRVFEAGEHLGIPYMIQEYVDGASCARLLKFLSHSSTRMPEAAALTIAREVLSALDYAHHATDPQGTPMGIVHRDVSPGNLLIGRDGCVKLVDFGIAQCRQHAPEDTESGQVKGKFGYMSPEQVAGDGHLDERTDLFSLGVVLAEMLIGKRLFQGDGAYDTLTRMYQANLEQLESRASKLSKPVLTVVKRALARDREQRFASAKEMLGAVESAASVRGLALGNQSLLAWLNGSGALPERSGRCALRADPSLYATRYG